MEKKRSSVRYYIKFSTNYKQLKHVYACLLHFLLRLLEQLILSFFLDFVFFSAIFHFFLLHFLDLLNLLLAHISCSFGIKSKHKVAVVEVNINAVIVIKASVTRSEMRFARTTTMPLVMTTLYTDTPMYCESLRAGIFTCRVSQAM